MIFDPSTGVVTQYPIREIFQKFYPDYARFHPVNEQQAKAANCISSWDSHGCCRKQRGFPYGRILYNN